MRLKELNIQEGQLVLYRLRRCFEAGVKQPAGGAVAGAVLGLARHGASVAREPWRHK